MYVHGNIAEHIYEHIYDVLETRLFGKNSMSIVIVYVGMRRVRVCACTREKGTKKEKVKE